MRKLKQFPYLVAIVGVLFITGISFFRTFSRVIKSAVPVVLGDEKEDEEDREDSEDNDHEEDEKDDDERDDEDEQDNDEQEEEDDNEDYSQSTTRTQQTRLNTQTLSTDREDDEEGADDSAEDQDENDTQENIWELERDVMKLDSRLSALAATGQDISGFSQGLAEVRSILLQAKEASVSQVSNAEQLIDQTEHKLERLEKLLKASLNEEADEDEDEEGEDSRDIAGNVREIENDWTTTNTLVDQAKNQGLDVSSLEAIMADAKILIEQTKEKLLAGLESDAEHLIEQAEDKIEAVKEALNVEEESDWENKNIFETYKSTNSQLVRNLELVKGAENSVNQSVGLVAAAQAQSSATVEQSITKIESRSRTKKLFLGPDYRNLKVVRREIIANQNRISILTQTMNNLTDPAVKSALATQIKLIKEQNTQLAGFVSQQEQGTSLFGWLMRLFS